MQQLAFALQKQQPALAQVLGTVVAQQAYLLVMLPKGHLAAFELHAPAMLQQLLPYIQGQGGGQPGLAFGKGAHASGMAQALAAARSLLLHSIAA